MNTNEAHGTQPADDAGNPHPPPETSMYEDFLNAQRAMGAVFAGNEVSTPKYRYKYASLLDVQKVCYPPLHANGLFVTQACFVNDGATYCRTSIIHLSGGVAATTEIPVIVANRGDAQAFGSGISYARRYGLLLVCGLATSDDDAVKANEPPPLVSNDQANAILLMIDETETPMQAFLQHYGITHVDQMTAQQAVDAVAQLERKKRQAAEAAAPAM